MITKILLLPFKAIHALKRKLQKEFYLSSFKKCGNNTIFYGDLPIIRNPQFVNVGNSVRFNEFSYLYAKKNAQITLSDNVTISPHAKIITGSYDISLLLTNMKNKLPDIHKDEEVLIGENSWLGMGSIILPGVKLTGDNVFVAAGAVVTKSFSESNILLAGNPAIIKKTYSPKSNI